jgi:hypothetical protein
VQYVRPSGRVALRKVALHVIVVVVLEDGKVCEGSMTFNGRLRSDEKSVGEN